MNNTNQTIIQDDEIDLKELFKTILKYKRKIFIFTLIVFFATLFYVLSIPNSYKSEIILSPQVDSKSSNANLASLASLAGVNLSTGSANKDPFVLMQTTLQDYEFNKMVIEKYNLIDKIEEPKNLVFPMNIDWFYSTPKNDKDETIEEKIFNTNKFLEKMISISSDKKTNLITLNVENPDRFFAKELLDIYLKEMTEKIKYQDMKEIDKQIEYYTKELSLANDVSLKEQLSKSLSSLMQKKVFSLSNDYYFVSKIKDSNIAYIKDKTKPKRGLILVVSIITSLIIGIFMAFILEFFRKDKNEKKS